MEHKANPYSPPSAMEPLAAITHTGNRHSGPLLYFAVAGFLAAVISVPLIVPRSLVVKEDPNPIGFLLILSSFPVGGLIYRLRSRDWPIDRTVRRRQIAASCATLLIPAAAASLNGMQGQGLHLTMLSAIVSLALVTGIFISGQRRDRDGA